MIPIDRPSNPGQNPAMGTVKDVGQVLQDFLVPELRALNVKVEALSSRTEAVESNLKAVNSRLTTLEVRLQTVEISTQSRFDRMEEKAAARQNVLLIQFDSLRNQLNLDGRLRELKT